MNRIRDTLDQFGQQIGLALGPGTSGATQLQLAAGGVLVIEPVEPAIGRGGEVLVYMGRPLGFDGGSVIRAALARAHHAAGSILPVQVAVRGDGPDALLVALVRMPIAEFTVQALNRAAEFLGKWTDGVHHG